MAAAGTRRLLGRYASAFPPVDLFRFAGQAKLRERGAQTALGRASFDYVKGADGLVHPANGEYFIGPNGCSLRPAGPVLYELVAHRPGNTRLVLIPAGTPMPAGFVVLHEHTDHFSLQTAVPCTPQDLDKRLNAFFKRMTTVLTRDEYLTRYPLQAS